MSLQARLHLVKREAQEEILNWIDEYCTLSLKETSGKVLEQFGKRISESTASKYLFIDEIGFDVSQRSIYGRAAPGDRPVITVRNIFSKNISVCAAMGVNGVVSFHALNQAFKADTFDQFCLELVQYFNTFNMNNIIVLCDNATNPNPMFWPHIKFYTVLLTNV